MMLMMRRVSCQMAFRVSSSVRSRRLGPRAGEVVIGVPNLERQTPAPGFESLFIHHSGIPVHENFHTPESSSWLTRVRAVKTIIQYVLRCCPRVTPDERLALLASRAPTASRAHPRVWSGRFAREAPPTHPLGPRCPRRRGEGDPRGLRVSRRVVLLLFFERNLLG